MFTGIIEATGYILEIRREKGNATFQIESPITQELKIDESVCHNGVCLTIEAISGNTYQVTAIEETLIKTNAQFWTNDTPVNLERSVTLKDRLNGHVVQGHVDGTIKCIQKTDKGGSVEFRFLFDKKNAPLVIEKGSVCINGVSLTAFDVSNDEFTVAIIPYTFSHTNFNKVNTGDILNIEYDILGKYIMRNLEMRNQDSSKH